MQLDAIKSHRWRIQPCSAVTGANLVEGLDWVVKDVAERSVMPLALERRAEEMRLDADEATSQIVLRSDDAA